MDALKFSATVATDPALFAEYLHSPNNVADQLGLDPAVRADLFSGDRTRVAVALGGVIQPKFIYHFCCV